MSRKLNSEQFRILSFIPLCHTALPSVTNKYGTVPEQTVDSRKKGTFPFSFYRNFLASYHIRSNRPVQQETFRISCRWFFFIWKSELYFFSKNGEPLINSFPVNILLARKIFSDVHFREISPVRFSWKDGKDGVRRIKWMGMCSFSDRIGIFCFIFDSVKVFFPKLYLKWRANNKISRQRKNTNRQMKVIQANFCLLMLITSYKIH